MKNPCLSLIALSPLVIAACTDLGAPPPATSEATGDVTAEAAEFVAAASSPETTVAAQAADGAEPGSPSAVQLATELTAAAAGPVWQIENCDGRLEQFRVSASNSAEHRWQQSRGGSWSGWASLGGELLYGDLTVFRNGDCKLEVFGTGTNHAVFTTWQSGPSSRTWISWASIGGYLISAPGWALNGLGNWGVCAEGRDHDLWCNFHTRPEGSPWTGWHKQ